MYCLFWLTTTADVCIIDWSMRVVGFLKHDKKLSMESLWYSSTEWFFKSSLVSFQLLYGWVIRNLALDPWCAEVGNKTHARQNNPSVDFKYDKKLKLSQNSCKQYRLFSPDFFRLSLYILGGNLNDFSGALFLINEFLQSPLIFDNGNTLIMSVITSGFVVVSTKTKIFLQRIKNGWNKIVNNFLIVLLSHLLRITIKRNHDKIQWVF